MDCHGTHELGWPSKFLTSKNHINPRHPGFFDLGKKHNSLKQADFLEMICLGTIGKMWVYLKIYLYIYICRKSALNRYPNVKLDSVTVPYYRCMIYVKAKKNTYTSSSRASRWRKFQKKKELYSKERICQ